MKTKLMINNPTWLTTLKTNDIMPIFIHKTLPGDTIKLNLETTAQLMNPIYNTLQNPKLKIFAFWCEMKNLNSNWTQSTFKNGYFNGEKDKLNIINDKKSKLYESETEDYYNKSPLYEKTLAVCELYVIKNNASMEEYLEIKYPNAKKLLTEQFGYNIPDKVIIHNNQTIKELETTMIELEKPILKRINSINGEYFELNDNGEKIKELTQSFSETSESEEENFNFLLQRIPVTLIQMFLKIKNGYFNDTKYGSNKETEIMQIGNWEQIEKILEKHYLTQYNSIKIGTETIQSAKSEMEKLYYLTSKEFVHGSIEDYFRQQEAINNNIITQTNYKKFAKLFKKGIENSPRNYEAMIEMIWDEVDIKKYTQAKLLATSSQELEINTITQTATTAQGTVGDTGGQSIVKVGLNNFINTSFNDYGYLMIVAYLDYERINNNLLPNWMNSEIYLPYLDNNEIEIVPAFKVTGNFENGEDNGITADWFYKFKFADYKIPPQSWASGLFTQRKLEGWSYLTNYTNFNELLNSLIKGESKSLRKTLAVKTDQEDIVIFKAKYQCMMTRQIEEL